MLTMVWLYLTTNQIINMQGLAMIVILLSIGTMVADGMLINSLCVRLRGKYK